MITEGDSHPPLLSNVIKRDKSLSFTASINTTTVVIIVIIILVVVLLAALPRRVVHRGQHGRAEVIFKNTRRCDNVIIHHSTV